MSNLNGKSPTVLVTDAGRGSAIAIIRSLGRKHYRVIAADADPTSPGFRSRFAKERLVYPAPEHAPREFCECLLQAASSRGIDLIIPVTDLAIQPLAKARASFAGVTRLAIAEDDKLAIVTDKDKTLALAKKTGVPVPETCVVGTAKEALAQAEKLGWPIVLKPQSSRKLNEGKGIDFFKVTYAADLADLQAQMQALEGRCSVLLQQYCAGIGYGVELLMSAGQPLAAFQHKRLREIPVSGGASAYRESVPLDRELYDYAVRLLQELRWTGLAMVEFKAGKHGAKLMEINGRVWGSLPLAVLSGMDFPALLAELCLEGPGKITPQLNSNYEIGVRARDLQKDLSWIVKVLKQQQREAFFKMPPRVRALRALLGFFNPARKYDVLSLSDPLPGFAELPRIVKKFRSKMNEDE
jgi:predicted ATP-grasp superfamily ATP-dependent carboligase